MASSVKRGCSSTLHRSKKITCEKLCPVLTNRGAVGGFPLSKDPRGGGDSQRTRAAEPSRVKNGVIKKIYP